METQTGYVMEMAYVSRHEQQIVFDGRRGDDEIERPMLHRALLLAQQGTQARSTFRDGLVEVEQLDHCQRATIDEFGLLRVTSSDDPFEDLHVRNSGSCDTPWDQALKKRPSAGIVRKVVDDSVGIGEKAHTSTRGRFEPRDSRICRFSASPSMSPFHPPAADRIAS